MLTGLGDLSSGYSNIEILSMGVLGFCWLVLGRVLWTLRHTRPPAQAFARWGGVLNGILQVFVLGGAMPSDRVRTYVPDRRSFHPRAPSTPTRQNRSVGGGWDHPLSHPRGAPAPE